MTGCSAISLRRTDAPSSSLFSSALIACNSCTRFMSIRTFGATMPRRMFTTRSVPPPSGMLSGFAVRAAITSSRVFGLSMRNWGRASITFSPSRTDARHPEVPAEGGPQRMTATDSTVDTPSRLAALAPQDDGSDSLPVALSLPLLHRLKYTIGRHWQIVEADTDRVGDRIGESRQECRKRAFARFLRTERAMRVIALDDADFDRRGI